MPSIPPQEIIDDFVGNAHGNFARVKELLTQYPSLLNANASWNERALEAASQVGSVEIAEYLLAAGAPTGICTEAMLGHAERVNAYLEADPSQANAKGAHGISVLYHALIRGHQDIGEMFLAAGAEVNAGAGGSPAIHGVVMFNQPAMIEWLLGRGADLNIKNYEGLTPLAAALKQGKTEIAEMLRRRGAAES